MKLTISYKGIIMEIKKAAIRIGNKIFTGFDHGECFNQIPQKLRNQIIEQGFVTDSNEFVDRKEAMIIARQANQIAYDDGEKKTLISEDLHLNWLNKMNKELAELKQKAIVLPFEFDKPIYKLCPKCNYQHTDCKNCSWRGCGFNQCYDICHEEDRGRIICEIILKKDNCNVSWNALRFISEHWGEYYFATKEEAEQKLAEIRGKDE